ncbi:MULTISPECIES: type III pantothenate kinase [Maricaulis]|jgi:type III pantothenate kinase|uniref:Type III pantothenate kinase n=1 Tax=Maricaulis maris (strain MCS10) TaxID=394221 RepID=COAX_MARMM|nr:MULTISPECIES: type III pantothenate kinase [Maricaulis]Q0APX5.1 RecName: Full=Type III pantothenate kinase; AltName: Full=PanK-III; AltName: Full=Pantothenic acid kinase [Maricaulis maris MCS10]ABI65662.1 pantothenate kinase [Maricaulis maris MCS10]MAC90620.1 type III pantothenate kinase [Maricaulis sp.]
MLLAIDCGNTNTLFAIHDGNDWVAQWRSGTDSTRTADEHAVWLSQLMGLQGRSFADITACVISTVVPQALFNLRNLSRRYFKAEPVIVGEPGVRMDIEVRLDRPQDAGADRLVNALGARAVYDGALIIIDSGTATTFDVIAADGAFEGGIIAPGINLSMQALHGAAAKLPRVAIAKPARVMGKDTVSAMQSGVFWGYIDLIDGLVQRLKSEYAQPMTVVATGGVVSLFDGASKAIDHYDADLTIRGLLEVWKLNGGADT